MCQPESTASRSKAEPEEIDLHLRAWILYELAAAPEHHLEPDTPLFESLLDSTSVLALVSHLEDEYTLEIRDSEIVPGNFSTLRRIEAFLQRKVRPSATQAMASGTEPVSRVR